MCLMCFNQKKISKYLKYKVLEICFVSIFFKKQIQTERHRNKSWDILIILLMAEIPNNHLECMKPYK